MGREGGGEDGRGWEGMRWGDEFEGLFGLLIYLSYLPTLMYLMVLRSRLPAAQIYSKVIQVHLLLKTSLVVIGIPRLN